MPEIILIIPAIGPSANKFYAGMHPMVRRKLAEQWHAMVIIEIKKQKIAPYSGRYPVDIECVCAFGIGSRALDADNLFPTAKLVIDALVRAGIIYNDSPKWVRSVKFVSQKHGLGKDKTVITIRGEMP